MGLFDTLRRAIRQSGEAAASGASKVATETAVRGAASAITSAAAKIGDELLDDAEKALTDGRTAREGRPSLLPDVSVADDLAERVAAAASVEAVSRGRSGLVDGAEVGEGDAELRARAELERLKARLGVSPSEE